MASQYQFILPDSVPESTLRKMKQSEDLVPDEFIFNIQPLTDQDTESVSIDHSEKLYIKYLTRNQGLEKQFVKRTDSQNFFPFILLTIALLLILLVKILYWKSLKQFYESLISFTKFRLWLRDTGSLLHNMFFLTTPAYILIFALATDFLIQKYSGSDYVFLLFRYGIILSAIILYIAIRHGLMIFSASVFNSKSAVEEQIRNIQVHYTFLLFGLMIVLPLSIYFPNNQLYYSIIPMAVLTEGIRIVKAFISAKTLKQYRAYYFFLYFCTVEIVPILLLIKLVSF